MSMALQTGLLRYHSKRPVSRDALRTNARNLLQTTAIYRCLRGQRQRRLWKQHYTHHIFLTLRMIYRRSALYTVLVGYTVTQIVHYRVRLLLILSSTNTVCWILMNTRHIIGNAYISTHTRQSSKCVYFGDHGENICVSVTNVLMKKKTLMIPPKKK